MSTVHADADTVADSANLPDNASIAAIKAKTDNLPASPAADANLDAAIASRRIRPTVQGNSGVSPATLSGTIETRAATA